MQPIFPKEGLVVTADVDLTGEAVQNEEVHKGLDLCGWTGEAHLLIFN